MTGLLIPSKSSSDLPSERLLMSCPHPKLRNLADARDVPRNWSDVRIRLPRSFGASMGPHSSRNPVPQIIFLRAQQINPSTGKTLLSNRNCSKHGHDASHSFLQGNNSTRITIRVSTQDHAATDLSALVTCSAVT
jgi:hypothetical protein